MDCDLVNADSQPDPNSEIGCKKVLASLYTNTFLPIDRKHHAVCLSSTTDDHKGSPLLVNYPDSVVYIGLCYLSKAAAQHISLSAGSENVKTAEL